MESGLKQRLIGAAVLVALAVIFLPMLVQGPAPDSGVSDLPLQMPDQPAGEYETRDLPLVKPGATSTDGVLDNDDALPTVDTTTAPPVADAPAASAPPDEAATSADMLPATTAGGNYAVSFGAYGSSANADTVVTRLRTAKLPGYREQAMLAGKPAWRVRIGPYATRAEAEALRAGGSRVELLFPDVATLAVFGINRMDTSKRGEALEAGALQGRELANRVEPAWSKAPA